MNKDRNIPLFIENKGNAHTIELPEVVAKDILYLIIRARRRHGDNLDSCQIPVNGVKVFVQNLFIDQRDLESLGLAEPYIPYPDKVPTDIY